MFHPEYIAPQKLINNNDILQLFQMVEKHGGVLRFVGGAVRDAIAGFNRQDIDLVTDMSPAEFSDMCMDEGIRCVPIGIQFFTTGVLINNSFFKVTSLCSEEDTGKDEWKSDAAKRDLTINAVAINIRSGEIVDLFGGIEDFQNRIIRGICDENFIDDPLRMLRIFRFHSVLGFDIDDSLVSVVRNNSELVLKPAKERVEYELMKLFNGLYVPQALLKMDESQVLELLFPFVRELKRVPPNAHHHLDLFNHSIETIRQLDILFENSCDEVKNHLLKADFGGFSRLAHLRLACFMHDIGKFSTWTIEEDTGRHRFIKHEDAGSKMAEKFLKSMCFSNRQISYITYIIKNHMYPAAVVSSPELSEKVMMRYIRKSEDNAIDNILIAQADRLSARGPEVSDDMVKNNIEGLNNLLEYYLKIKDTLKPLPKLLDGNEVMKILNIKPSKRLGEIMEALHEAQISGDVLTKEDAVSFVKTIL